MSEHSSDIESCFSSSAFQEPSCQDQSFESVTVHLPAVIIQPQPITTLPPLNSPFEFQSNSTSIGNQSLVNMVALAFLFNRYAPLQLLQHYNQMPKDYLKILPRFSGEDTQTTENHVVVFCNFVESVNVKHLVVVLRHFVQSFDGEARKWFKGLPNNYFPS